MIDKPCHCLLSVSDADMAKIVHEYVDLLADDVKASSELYALRLSVCSKCENLYNGTCSLCGCYVEARAAKKSMNCPDIPAKW